MKINIWIYPCASGSIKLADRLRGGAVATMLTENFGAIFNGDGYSQEWQVQVDKRGVLSSAEGGLSRRACSASWFDGALLVTNIRSRSVCKGSWNQCATSCGTQRFCVSTCVMSSEVGVVDAQECACAEKAACQTRLPQACAVCPPSAPSLHGCHLQKAEMARQIHLP